MDAACIFKRIEKKYLLSEAQQEALFQRIGAHLRPDEFGRSTVLSLYLDTPDRRIIRNSIEAADYKEKLRLRSYGTAGEDSTVFLELKKKYGGVVYKRRAAMTLKEAERYLRMGLKPFESQIMAEIDWAMRLYGRPKAAMLIACEREAWFDEAHPDLRLTFDRNIRCRENELRLDRGSAGTPPAAEGHGAARDQNGGRHAAVAGGRAGRGEHPAGQLLQVRRGLSADAGRKGPSCLLDRRRTKTCRQSLIRS